MKAATGRAVGVGGCNQRVRCGGEWASLPRTMFSFAILSCFRLLFSALGATILGRLAGLAASRSSEPRSVMRAMCSSSTRFSTPISRSRWSENVYETGGTRRDEGDSCSCGAIGGAAVARTGASGAVAPG